MTGPKITDREGVTPPAYTSLADGTPRAEEPCTSRSVTRTWPIQALLDHPRITIRAVAEAIHVSGARLNQLRVTGLTDWQADRAAIRLGLLPHLVWPDWVDAGLTVNDRQFVTEGWRPAWLHRASLEAAS